MREAVTRSAVLAALLLVSSAAEAKPPRDVLAKVKAPECGTCGKQTYDTSIEWLGSPSEAARKAKEEEKLVFVLHVSGHFEDAKFT